MKITILGLSSIGIAYALLFASFGHEVIAYDINKYKIEYLKQGIPLSQEKSSKEILVKWGSQVNFCTDINEALNQPEIVYITSDTFESARGGANLDDISNFIDQILRICRKKVVVVLKSYAPVGTTKQIERIMSQHRFKHDIVSNPEFARIGNIVEDVFHPSRIVIGVENVETHFMMNVLYGDFVKQNIPVIFTSLESAEMIKYASDRFLAVKLSFINEVALFCETTGADIDVVSRGMGYDPRIGPLYLKASFGYGGLNSLKKATHEVGPSENKEILEMSKTAENINRKLPKIFAKRIVDRFMNDASITTIAILGLSHKGGISDISNSPAFTIIDTLLKNDIKVIAYDQFAENDFSKVMYKHKKLRYASDLNGALKRANGIVIINDAEEFKNLTVERLTNLMPTKPVVFDGKNLFNPIHMSAIEYYSIGRPIVHKYKEEGPLKE